MRIKVCFNCKKYCKICPENYESNIRERAFDSYHKKHQIQLLSLEEYLIWKKENKAEEW